jgi:hypothetical protein
MRPSVVREAQERQHRRKQRSLDLTFELMVNNFRIRYTETSICKSCCRQHDTLMQPIFFKHTICF